MALCLLLTPAAAAGPTDFYGTEAVEQALPPEAGDLEPEQQDFWQTVLELVQRAWNENQSLLRRALRAVLRTVVLLILCQLIAMSDAAASDGIAALTGALGTMACCGPGMLECFRLTHRAMEEMTTFCKVLLPVVASTAASAGSPANAASCYGLTMVFSAALEACSLKLLFPGLLAVLSFSLVDAAMGEKRLDRLSKLLQSGIGRGLRAMVYVFTAVITITGAIAGNHDAGTLKALKFSISAAVPVVGGIISDAADSVLTGAALLKTSVGTLGMAAILATAMAPFLHLAVCYLLLKGAAALGGVMESRTANLLDTMASVLGCLMAIVGSAVYLYLASCVSLIRIVQG